MKNSMDMKSLPKLGATRSKSGAFFGSKTADTPKEKKPLSERVKGLSSKVIQARNAHEARQVARYQQKTQVQSARAGLAEQKARIRRANRVGRGHRSDVLKHPFQGKIKYKGDRDD
jgi:hypothetical protein